MVRLAALKRRIFDAACRQLTIDAPNAYEGPGGQSGTAQESRRGRLYILNS
jgi:hypothetical protein